MGAAKILVSSPDEVKLTIWQDNDKTDEVSPNIKENVCYYTMDNEAAYKFLTEKKLEVTDSLNNWKEIKLADGNEGWLPDSCIVQI